MPPQEFGQFDRSLSPFGSAAFQSLPDLQESSPFALTPEQRAHEQIKALNAADIAARESLQPRMDAPASGDYKNPRTFDNPYQHLQQAHDTVRAQGMQAAQREYSASVVAADRIDQQAVQQDRMQTLRSRNMVDQQLQSGTLPPQEAQRLQVQREYLAQREKTLYELYLAPATSRSNMAFACIRSGDDSYVRYGEQLLAQAVQARPEIELDPNFQRHKRDAYLEMQRKRNGAQPLPPGPGDGYGPRPPVLPPSVVPPGGNGRPPVYPPAGPGGDGRPPVYPPPGPGGDGRPPVLPPPGPGGDGRPPVLPPPGPGGDGRPPVLPPPGPGGDGTVPAFPPGVPGGDLPFGPGSDTVPPPGGAPEDQDPAKETRWLSPEQLKNLAENPAVWIALVAAGWYLVKKGNEWYLERKAAQNGTGREGTLPLDPARPPEGEQGREPQDPNRDKDGRDQPPRDPNKDKETQDRPGRDPLDPNNDREVRDQPGREQPGDQGRAGNDQAQGPDGAKDNLKLLFERETVIDGKKVVIRVSDMLKPDGTPLRDSEERNIRRVEYIVDGKSHVLEGASWFQSKNFGNGHGDVKLHVTTVSAQDLARVQATIIPELFEAAKPGGPLHGKLDSFKTIDPTYGFDRKMTTWWAQSPDVKDQGAKGLTIYAKDEVAAKEIYDWLSAKLKEKGLTLEGHHDTNNVGDMTRDRAASNRVSIERDYYAKGEGRLSPQQEAMLSEQQKLAERIKDYAERKAAEKAPGWDFPIYGRDGRLTKEAMDRFLLECKDAGGTAEQKLVDTVRDYAQKRIAEKGSGWDATSLSPDGKPTQQAVDRFLRESEVAGAVVEEKLAEGIKEYIQRRAAEKATGWDFPVLDPNMRLTERALERFLREVGVDGRSCALAYERTGRPGSPPRLIFISTGEQSHGVGAKFYLDESEARKKAVYDSRTGEPIGLLTGRPALYRISDRVGTLLGVNMDPAHLAYERRSASHKTEEAIRKRMETEGKDYVSSDGKTKVRAVELKAGERLSGSDWAPFEAGDHLVIVPREGGEPVKMIVPKDFLEQHYKAVDASAPPVDTKPTPDRPVQERERLEKEIRDLQIEKQQAQDKIKELERQVRELGADATTEKERLNSEIASLTQQRQQLEERIGKLGQQVTEAKEAQAAAERANGELAKQVEELGKANKEAQTKREELEKQVREGKEAADAKERQLQTELEGAKQGQQQGQEKIGRLEQQLKELGEGAQAKKTELTAEIERLKEAQGKAQERMTELDRQLKEAKEAAATKEGELKRQLEGVKQAQQQSQEKIEQLEKQLKTAKESTAAEREQWKAQIEELTRKQQADQGKIGDLEKQVREGKEAATAKEQELTRQIETLKQTQQQASEKAGQLERQLTEAKEAVRVADAKNADLAKQVEELGKANKEAQTKREELEKQVREGKEAADAKERQLQTELEGAKQGQQQGQEKIGRLEQQVKELGEGAQAKKTELTAEIERLKEAQGKAQERVTELDRQLKEAKEAAATKEGELKRQLEGVKQAQQQSQEKIEQLEKQLKTAKETTAAEREQWKAQIEELTRKQQADQGKIGDLEKQVREGKEAATAKEQELTRQIETLKQSQQQSAEKAGQLERQLTEAKEALRTSEAARVELAKQVEELGKANKEAQTKREELEKQVREGKEAADAKERQLQTELEGAKQGQQQGQEKIGRLEQQLKELGEGAQAKKTELTAEIERLKEAQGKAQERVTELDRQLKEAKEAAATKEGELKRQLGGVKQAQQQSQEKIEQLEKQLKTAKETTAAERVQWKAQIEELTRKQQADQGKIGDLEKQVREGKEAATAKEQELTRQIETLKQSQQQASEKAGQLERQLTETKEALRTAEAARVELAKQVEALGKANKEAQTKREELEKQLREAKDASTVKEGELKTQLEGAKQAQQQGQEKIAQLERQLKELGEGAAEKKTELTAEIERLKGVQGKQQEKVDGLERQLREAKEAATAKELELTRQLEGMKQAQQQSQEKIEQLEKQLKTAKESTAAEREQWKAQVEELTRKQADERLKGEQLEKQLKEAKEAEQAVKAKNEELLRELETVRQAQQREQTQMQELQRKLQEAEARLKERPQGDSDAGADRATRGPSEVEIRGMKIKVGFEAQVGDAKWRVVGQDPKDGHLIVQKVGNVDLSNKVLQKLEDGSFHKVKIMGGQGEYYRREGTDEIYKVVTVERTLGGERMAGTKFVVLVDEVVVKGPRSPIISGICEEVARQATATPVEGERVGSAFGEKDKIELSKEIARELTFENGVATVRGQKMNLVEMASKSLKEKQELLEKIKERLAKADGEAAPDPDLPKTREELVQLQKELQEKYDLCKDAHKQAVEHGNYKPLHDLAAKELPDRIAESERMARPGEGRGAEPHGGGGGGRWRACLFVFAAALPLILIKPSPSQAAPVPPVFAPTIPSSGNR